MLKGLCTYEINVDLLSMNTTKHPVSLDDALQNLQVFSHIDLVALDNRIHWIPLIRSIIRGDSYHISRFVSPAFDRQLEKILLNRQYKIIQLESIYLTPYIPTIRRLSKAPIVLRAHNVEWKIWQRLAQRERNPIKKYYLQYAWKKLKEYETAQLRKVDAIVPISNLDQQGFESMGSLKPQFTFPLGLDLNEMHYKAPEALQTHFELRFIGSLDWLPNQEGLIWFMKKVWPLLIDQFPHIKCSIAGRNCPDFIRDLCPKGMVIVGEVADAKTFVQGAPISVVPLLSGGGMRAKIIEAMALGPVVLSTSIGIEGIPAINGKSAMICDHPYQFVDAISAIWTNPSLINEISSEARSLVEQHFDTYQISKNYFLFLQNLLID